jgi:hypothetical protein
MTFGRKTTVSEIRVFDGIGNSDSSDRWAAYQIPPYAGSRPRAVMRGKAVNKPADLSSRMGLLARQDVSGVRG